MNNGGAAIGGRPGVRPHLEITARLVGVGAPWRGGRRWINCSVAGEEQPRRAGLPTRSTDSGAARAAKVLQAGNWPIGSQTGGRDKLEEEGAISPSAKCHPKNFGGLAGPAECARNNANLEATAPAAEVVDAPQLNATR